MNIKKLLLFSSVVVASMLSAQSISISNHWKLLGAVENIDTSAFDQSGCVDFVWKYNNGWQLHIANEKNYPSASDFANFNEIKKGEGFWIIGSKNCNIDTKQNQNESSNSNLKFTKELLSANPWYEIEYSEDGQGEDGCIGKKVYKLDGTFVASAKDYYVTGKYVINDKGEFAHIIDGKRDKYYKMLDKDKNNTKIVFKGWNEDGTKTNVHIFFKSKKEAEDYFENDENCFPDE